MSKSYVALQNEVCIVCGKEVAAGILLDMRLRDTLPKSVTTGFKKTPCDDCNKKMRPKDGSGDRVALIGCDESKSEILLNGNADPNGAYRTGAICFLRVDVWKQIMNVPVPLKLVCFCGDDVIEKLNQMTTQANQEQENN